jgi:uncharacterized membrane protein
MNYNLHPLIVHFPIALLMTYSVFELIRFKKISGQPYWFYLKAILVILGTLSALVAYQFGEIARELIPGGRGNPLVSQHQNWAKISIIIYSIIVAGYSVQWLKQKYKIWSFLIKLQTWITESPLILLLALAGLIALSITGALGGIIVYGVGVDPFADYITKLLIH